MKFSKMTFGLAAAALATMPAVAQVAAAPTLAPLVGDESEQAQGFPIIIGLLAAAAVVTAVVVVSSDDEEELPISG